MLDPLPGREVEVDEFQARARPCDPTPPPVTLPPNKRSLPYTSPRRGRRLPARARFARRAPAPPGRWRHGQRALVLAA